MCLSRCSLLLQSEIRSEHKILDKHCLFSMHQECQRHRRIARSCDIPANSNKRQLAHPMVGDQSRGETENLVKRLCTRKQQGELPCSSNHFSYFNSPSSEWRSTTSKEYRRLEKISSMRRAAASYSPLWAAARQQLAVLSCFLSCSPSRLSLEYCQLVTHCQRKYRLIQIGMCFNGVCTGPSNNTKSAK